MITIIVLLILAGVTLSLVSGGDGILSKASSAVDTSNEETAKEQVMLKIAEFQTQFYDEVYVNQNISVNTKMGDWIAENKAGEIETEDYTFEITGTAPYTVTILKNNNLKTEIVGSLTQEGKVDFEGSGSESSGSGSGGIGGSTPETPTYTAYSVGAEITIGEEGFYVIEASDENTEMVTLLAKYVLDASATKQTNEDIYCVFSTSNHWKDETLPSSSPYFNLNDYPAVKSDTGSAVYKANKYATEGLGAESGRLLTYEEANALEDSIPDIIWVTYGNLKYYWLGSADSTDDVWYVHGGDRIFDNIDYDFSYACGVRPVIEISKSLIQE